MPAIAFPRRSLGSLHELASRVLEKRSGSDHDTLARDLLAGFYEVCMRAGLDGVLAELERELAPLEIVDGFALADDPRIRSALSEKLGRKSDFDPGGPGNAKPRQLADCLSAVLSLNLTDEPDRTTTLADTVRVDVMAALGGPVEIALAVPQIRDTIIANGRQLCEERFHQAYDRLAAVLDERGVRITRQPKLPLDAVQAVQQALIDARRAIVEKVAGAAIERAKQVLARVDPDLAARIELPITHEMTPRDVAIRRASDPRHGMIPGPVVHALLDGLTESARIAWRAAERPVRTYSASQTFAVGDLVEHPKFGRGSVLSCETQRMEVEFPDGKVTLVHARK